MKNSQTPTKRPPIKQPSLLGSLLLHKAFKAEFPAFSSSIVYKKRKLSRHSLAFANYISYYYPTKWSTRETEILIGYLSGPKIVCRNSFGKLLFINIAHKTVSSRV